MMAKLPTELLEKGVICSSAGNHAQGVALAAKRLNCSAVIAMPVTTPEIKVCFVYMFTFAWFVCYFLLKWKVIKLNRPCCSYC